MAKIIRRRTVLAIGIAAGSLATPMLAHRSQAQGTYPAGETVCMVVPFAAGGNVSAEIVARAPPDGMTLLLGTVGTAVTNQYLYKALSYDNEGSFAPVALVGEVANIVAVPSSPSHH